MVYEINGRDGLNTSSDGLDGREVSGNKQQLQREEI